MKNTIQEELNNKEKAYQRKQKDVMKGTIDYQLTKGEVDAFEHTSQALRILRDYNLIISQITNHENR